jgi:hypothetical protein
MVHHLNINTPPPMQVIHLGVFVVLVFDFFVFVILAVVAREQDDVT